MSMIIRLGTRASQLALKQSGLVAESLRNRGHAVEIVPLVSAGDLSTEPLAGLANQGIFVTSVREALLHHEIDVAVHSFKDVPTQPVSGITLGAVPAREDARDTFVSASESLEALPSGATVGTCSVRRAAWVGRKRPDIKVTPIRGNIDGRIDQMNSGNFDGIILAAAGLIRLGRADEIRQFIEIPDLVPAPAQGALAVECRSNDRDLLQVLSEIDHAPSRLAALLERSVLHEVDSSDNTAFGVHVSISTDSLHMIADISDHNGGKRLVVKESRHISGGIDVDNVISALRESVILEIQSHQRTLVSA